jgi:adenine-specific DNA glycosylase
LTEICRARQADEVESFPPPKKPKEWLRVREELHCVLDGKGQVLLHQRPKGQWRAGLWDLLQQGPAKSCKKSWENIGVIETRYVVTRHKVTRLTHVWKMKKRAQWQATEGESSNEGELRWVSVLEPEVAAGSPLKRTLQYLRERYGDEI